LNKKNVLINVTMTMVKFLDFLSLTESYEWNLPHIRP